MKCEDCKYRFKNLDGLCSPAESAYQIIDKRDADGCETRTVLEGDCIVSNPKFDSANNCGLPEKFLCKWVYDCRGNLKLVLSTELHGAMTLASDRILEFVGMEERRDVRGTL